MTLIVGVKCDDGVVVGADSAATFGGIAMKTIQQPHAKVEVIEGMVLLAASGPVGLRQRFAGELREAWLQKKLGAEPWKAMTILRKLFLPHIQDEFKAAQAAEPVLGSSAAAQSVLSHTLVAAPIGKLPCLFQFDQQGAPEEARLDLPFVCAGSGQTLADPFLAFLKTIFWPPDRLPSVPAAIFATLWTIDQAVEVAPGGLAQPTQIFTLAKQDSKWVAQQLGDSDLGEHRQAIAGAKKALKEFRSGFRPSKQGTPPPSV